MRTYQESAKSKKTVSSMIEKKNDNKEDKKCSTKSIGTNGVAVQPLPELPSLSMNGILTDDIILQNRQKLVMKRNSPSCKKSKT